jgi:hypothetical protein
VISHVTLEIDAKLVRAELDFWGWLGYKRLQRTRHMGVTEWLRSWPGLAEEGCASSWVHLMPVPAHELPYSELKGRRFVGGRSHLAVVVGSQFENIVASRLYPVSEVADHWGPRVFTQCPTGWRVELLRQHPAAKWPAAPVED